MSKKKVRIPAHDVVVCRNPKTKKYVKSVKFVRSGSSPDATDMRVPVCRRGTEPETIRIPTHTQTINVCKKVGGFGTMDGQCPRRAKSGPHKGRLRPVR